MSPITSIISTELKTPAGSAIQAARSLKDKPKSPLKRRVLKSTDTSLANALSGRPPFVTNKDRPYFYGDPRSGTHQGDQLSKIYSPEKKDPSSTPRSPHGDTKRSPKTLGK